MKKAIASILCILLVLSLLPGCANAEQPEDNKDTAEDIQNTEDVQSAEDPLGDYPENTIQFIVNRAAGGNTDLVARAVANTLQSELGYTTVVRNVDGGDGLIGANEALSAAPDGYTLMAVGSLELPNILVNFEGATFTKEDIVPICQLSAKSNLFILKPDSPFSSIEDFTAYAKEHPGELTVAVAGSNAVFGPMKLEDAMGVDITIVNAGSGNDAYASVLGGHVDCAMVSDNFYQNALAEGMTVMGSTANRTENIEGTADTFLSMGYKIVNETFTYLCAPKGIPESIVKFISDTLEKLADDGALAEALESSGNSCDIMGYEEFTPYYESYLTEQMANFEKVNEENN